MASRQITRRILISAAIAVFLIFVLFIQPHGPPSPAIRAPGHIEKSGSHVAVKDEMLKGEIIMPRLGNDTVKAELGRATWRYFHTMLARYPEEPTDDQQETLRSFVYLFARLYPCGECATHFQQQLKQYPPQVSSRNAAAGWGCFIHNEVNSMLDKTLFDCNDIGDFYDCGCEDHEEGETGTGTGMGTGEARSQSQSTDQREDHDTSPLVEISREPTTQG